MKGIVFDEFLQMVEANYGLITVDSIITKSDLPSGGVYTTVGTYDFNEMVALVTELSQEIDVPVPDLLHHFGHYLFDSLVKTHPEVVSSYSSPLSLIASIEDHIHVHVKKLYPDAELPTFKILEQTDTQLRLVYTSSRGLYMLAKGLMEKTFEHFGQKVNVDFKLLREDGKEVEFTLKQVG
ncbi:heme NO-binding domain-containing protein [Croceivirga thetidis]|uniref:Heme NO-binding domain-containing protein n=1 Tax=Croceivirga thetidis TaxID=2721623 RepID=A0ABX1GLE5_9FLAO|nr:heme NO-binding domain-containing protein [Croceivirga thetidis]NKI30725.1 hypothetical protein [Croceivirga thetidis]